MTIRQLPTASSPFPTTGQCISLHQASHVIASICFCACVVTYLFLLLYFCFCICKSAPPQWPVNASHYSAHPMLLPLKLPLHTSLVHQLLKLYLHLYARPTPPPTIYTSTHNTNGSICWNTTVNETLPTPLHNTMHTASIASIGWNTRLMAVESHLRRHSKAIASVDRITICKNNTEEGRSDHRMMQQCINFWDSLHHSATSEHVSVQNLEAEWRRHIPTRSELWSRRW